jgi:hypothetical protein
MSELNFPSKPVDGQTWTIGSNTWVWNDANQAWIKTSPISTNTSTVSTSTTTGALIVSGGIGVGGAVNAGSTSTINGAEIVTTATINQYAPVPTLQSVTNVGNTTTNIVKILNTTESTSTTTGALLVEGGIGVGGDIWVEGRLTSESVKIMDAVFDSTVMLVNTTGTVVIDAYSVDQFRSAKYLIQIDEGDGPTADFQTIEILLLVDNVGTVYATEYAVLTTNGEMGEFEADVQMDDIVRLYFTPYYPTAKNIKVLRTGLAS